jgi:hypothetical protein
MSIRKSPASNDDAPQRRPHARHQLVDSERLGDVVVRSRIESVYLGPLLALD